MRGPVTRHDHRAGASVGAAALLVGLAACVLLLVAPGAADAAPQLSASPTDGLKPDANTSVTVTGSGYDTSKGIYVAYCVVPPRGAPPSPCGGGADTTGSTGASTWYSDDPPRYGEGLAQPYGPGGSFRTTVNVTPRIGDVDCTRTACAIVTRNDHTRSQDRSQDVFVPVTFAAPPPPAPEPSPAPAPEPEKPARDAGASSTAPRSGGGTSEPAPSGASTNTSEATPEDADDVSGEPADEAETDEDLGDEPEEPADEAEDVEEEEDPAELEADEDPDAAELDEEPTVEASTPLAAETGGVGILVWVAALLIAAAGTAGVTLWRRSRRAGSSA